MVGNMFCMVMPTIIVEFLEHRGMTTAHAWSVTGGFLGALTMITIIITVIVSKNRDLPREKHDVPEASVHKKQFSLLNIFREYISVAKLRPMKYLIAASLCSLILYTMLMSNMLYFLTYNLGMSAVQISFCFPRWGSHSSPLQESCLQCSTSVSRSSSVISQA